MSAPKAMCRGAFDRAAKMPDDATLDRARRWFGLAEGGRRLVLSHGFNEKRGAFRRAFDDDALDGAVLSLPIAGIIDAKDERMVRTVGAIERELASGNPVYLHTADNGTGGAQGIFVALADADLQQGLREDRPIPQPLRHVALMHAALSLSADGCPPRLA